MKKQRVELDKKLFLNKAIVASLSQTEQGLMNGGAALVSQNPKDCVVTGTFLPPVCQTVATNAPCTSCGTIPCTLTP